MRCLVLALILLGSTTAGASEVDLRLKDGSTVHGELVSSDADKVVIKQTIEGKKSTLTATRTYQRAEIDTVAEVEDAATTYAKRAATVGEGAADQLQLAAWCRDNGLRDQARTHALKAIAAAPADPAAAKLLTSVGMIEVEGRWQDEAAYLERTGQVRYDDRVMTKAEADTLREAARAKAAQSAADQEATDNQRAIATHGAEATTIQAKLDDIAKQIQAIDAQIAKADDAKRRSDQANAAYTAASAASSGGATTAGAATPAAQAAAAQNAAETKRLRDAADAARAEAASAQTAAAQGKTKKATLQREHDALEKKLAQAKLEQQRAQQRLDADRKEAAAAQAAAAQGQKQPAAAATTPTGPAAPTPSDDRSPTGGSATPAPDPSTGRDAALPVKSP